MSQNYVRNVNHLHFCTLAPGRPTCRHVPHGHRPVQDCTGTWMLHRSNSSRMCHTSCHRRRYRTDAGSGAWKLVVPAVFSHRSRRCEGNHNFQSKIWNLLHQKLNRCRMSSTLQRCCHISSICRRICDGGRIQSRLGI